MLLFFPQRKREFLLYRESCKFETGTNILPFVQVEQLSAVDPDGFPFDWYDIADAEHFWFMSRIDAFLRLCKKHVPLDAPLHCFEIGCGNGLVRRQLEKKTGWTIDGGDINLKALELNTGLRGKTYLYNIHDRRPELANAYDVVILFDVLEHIPDTKEFLESCLYHLKPGGYLFLNVPALNRFKSHYDEVVGHIRRYSKSRMAAEFSALDARVTDQRYWALSLVPLLLLRKWFGKKSGSEKEIVENGLEPPAELFNKLLYLVLKTENTLLPAPPVGASLLTVVKKN